ncbi:MAG: tetratricopeptide repeat protein [Bacteroidetes bacterium]|nr:tetratricopeptide repeat protein [Bacteroidota bacterium]
MPVRFKQIFFLTLPFLAILLSGCLAVQDSAMAKFFHNLTARYNIYFNAHERYLSVIQNTEESYVDDYNLILNVFRFPDEAIAKSNGTDADEIIKKCTKILDKHKMSNWIDDSYYLIARAYFYKGDYFSAIETFQYVMSEYENSDLAFESMVWLAKCNYQLKKYEQAIALVSQIKSMQGLPGKLKKDLHLLEAYLNINQKDYVSAISNLEEAIMIEKKKEYKTRYSFILAQVFQASGDFDKAIKNYEKVIKKNPPYDMAFNAKIEVSRCFEVIDEKTAKSIKARLYKMLKDDKNIQYLDQIYFEIALIDLKIGNTKAAEENLRLSLKYNKNNDNQKAFAYLKLAEFYFDEPNYLLSKAYYDSSSTFLNEDYAGYGDLKKTSMVLSELVKHLVTVETEDSLLYLASLSTKSRDSLINLVWQAEETAKREIALAAQQKKIQEEQEMRYNRDVMMGQNRNLMQPPGIPGSLSTSGEWYFYNKSAVELGKSEFAVKWGKRKLEDDWRRKKKLGNLSEEGISVDSSEIEEVIEAVLTEEEKKFIGEQLKSIPKPKQKYYMDIPFTESQVEASHKRILEALKKIGDIYLDQLADTNNSSVAYENLIERYPNSKYDAQTHYTLFNIYNSPLNASLKQAHKDTILTKYPNSDYSILVEDPDYFTRLATVKSKEIKELYNESYQLYLKGDCDKLSKNVEISNKEYPGNFKNAQFNYLGILCSGKSKSNKEFIELLINFQKTNKNKEINDHAENMIKYLNGEFSVTAVHEESAKKETIMDSFMLKTPYEENTNSPYYFAYFFDSRKVNTGNLKTAFSDYNLEYYSLQNLSINTVILDEQIMLLLVQQFDEISAAMKYYNGIKTDASFLVKIKNRNPEIAVISQENFTILLTEKNQKDYLKFFMNLYFK